MNIFQFLKKLFFETETAYYLLRGHDSESENYHKRNLVLFYYTI